MTTVTGDYAIDFSGEANANPYTTTGLTVLNGDSQTVSGAVKPSASGSFRGFRRDATPTGTLITSKIEIAVGSATLNDPVMPAIVTTAGNGYGIQLKSAQFRVYPVTAHAVGAQIGLTVNEAWSAGDTFEFSLDTATGNLNAWHNAVQVVTDYNDTTYSTSLGAAFYNNWDDSNGHGVISFAADGYAAAVSITPTDTTPTDGTLQTITPAGMTGPVTAASIGGLDILASLSGTDPSVPITFTVDVSATETKTGMPRVGALSTISFTTATDGAVTTDVTIQPAANWATVTLAGTLDKTVDGFLDRLDTVFTEVSAVGDIIYYSNARGESITATGVYTGGTTIAYQSTEFVWQDATGASATATSPSEGGAFFPFGEAPSGGNKLTGIKLTSRKILATKLARRL